ncbi:hypothetical protein U1Q18_002061, partial [Sarracenia purpurea var. burkii]
MFLLRKFFRFDVVYFTFEVRWYIAPCGGFVEDWCLALPGCFIPSSVCRGGQEWCPKHVFPGPCFDLSGRVLIERTQRSCSGYDLLEGLLWLMPTLPQLPSSINGIIFSQACCYVGFALSRACCMGFYAFGWAAPASAFPLTSP